jgi:uncharacterized protein (AIM24 family)
VETEVRYGPSFALATVRMAPGETLKADGGAMVAMSSTVDIQTDTQGEFMQGLHRSVLGIGRGSGQFAEPISPLGAAAELP